MFKYNVRRATIWLLSICKPKLSDLIILDDNATIEELVSKKKSVLRFGDGELVYALGFEHVWQEQDSLLRKELVQSLNANDGRLLVCIPDFLSGNRQLKRKNIQKAGWGLPGACLRLLLRNHKKTYGSAFAFRPINHITNSDVEGNIKKILSYLRSKNILYVGSNQEIFKYIKVQHWIRLTNETNSYKEVNEIERKIREAVISNPDIVILIECGLTATILIHRLKDVTCQCVDIGSFFTQVSVFYAN